MKEYELKLNEFQRNALLTKIKYDVFNFKTTLNDYNEYDYDTIQDLYETLFDITKNEENKLNNNISDYSMLFNVVVVNKNNIYSNSNTYILAEYNFKSSYCEHILFPYFFNNYRKNKIIEKMTNKYDNLIYNYDLDLNKTINNCYDYIRFIVNTPNKYILINKDMPKENLYISTELNKEEYTELLGTITASISRTQLEKDAELRSLLNNKLKC